MPVAHELEGEALGEGLVLRPDAESADAVDEHGLRLHKHVLPRHGEVALDDPEADVRVLS